MNTKEKRRESKQHNHVFGSPKRIACMPRFKARGSSSFTLSMCSYAQYGNLCSLCLDPNVLGCEVVSPRKLFPGILNPRSRIPILVQEGAEESSQRGFSGSNLVADATKIVQMTQLLPSGTFRIMRRRICAAADGWMFQTTPGEGKDSLVLS